MPNLVPAMVSLQAALTQLGLDRHLKKIDSIFHSNNRRFHLSRDNQIRDGTKNPKQSLPSDDTVVSDTIFNSQ
ncbi:hypothetical protein SAY87_003420 [Trapa incisa]|uniref:Uncharacterized protein n=1 Tax=Trapa incisa TaxID=236973 RepID=A0AAN7KJ40_9MYRT|nr:hypothetical protein SAY87_003420 [Trapa incisa]